MHTNYKAEEVFNQIIERKLLVVSKNRQKYIFFILVAIFLVENVVALFTGVERITYFLWINALWLLPFIFYAFFRSLDFAPNTFYFLSNNIVIASGMLWKQYSTANVPEIFIIIASAGLIAIHLFLVVKPPFVIAQSILGLILFTIALRDNLDTPHAVYDFFLILGSVIVAAFTAFQRFKMTLRELIAQTIIYHSNQKLAKQEAELNEKSKQIFEKERNLRAILDNSNMAIWLLDTKFCLVEYNVKFQQYIWHTYQEEVHYGDNFLEKIKRFPKAQFWKERFEKAIFQGERQTYIDYYPEFKHYIQVELFPILVDNEIVGVSIFGKNITKQKIAEQTIQYNQQLLSSISQNIQEAIYRSTPTQGLIYANDAFLKLFGYNEKEIFNLNPTDLYVDSKKRSEIINRVLKEGVVKNEEVVFRRKDGSQFWGLVSLIAQKDHEGNIYFDGAIRDISESKENQRKLQEQNEELTKINNELDRFVYSASHDLKAPLASILGLINIAKMEKNTDMLFHYLDMMEQSVRKLDNFIKDIIDYSRNSRLEIACEPVDLQKIIDEIYENLNYLEKSIFIKKNTRIQAQAPFYTDKKRLSVILNNLLSNAINYHNIRKLNPFINIEATITEKEAKIEITDNGLGIAHEHLGKIFDMFYRASYDSKGSGLGLYIVKETIQKLGGKISVHSELGEGTRFTLIIPNHTPTATKISSTQESNEISVQH
ncbi:MAG: PAS domain-containing sensor histidine kinase [Raineya sp.]|nr:PAS domain-containing sensor histidine kinase [Raineya sp.]